MILIQNLIILKICLTHLTALLDQDEVMNIVGYSPAITSFVGSNAGLYTYS